ncbi:hypothetical protein LX97_01164 [Nonlabens dokdonensis]|uniref:Membrane protein n=2 Tax=Nonlabens dokdonensis TaxID=328515 RepID=L7W9I4_NONDD|nr:DUF6427 family protein [Nonlabens dokdonensis]AGC76501.1 membrane protein [Nonlabens dokdonensis DSW-6]PZX44155.1 hypothetical protein LX97_01164 [Nonlabens dokdonensis]
MLSSFFRTSKPIHFIITFLMVLFATGYYIITHPYLGWGYVWIPITAGLSIGLFHFIAIKNEFISNNSYGIWLYSCLLILVILYSTSEYSFLAYLFLLLALRRILSMRTGKQMTRKIFDASLWIAVACIFYSWSTIFFTIVFLSITIHAFKNLKYWAVPFVAISTILILTFTIDQYFTTNLWRDFFSELNDNLDYTNIKFSSDLVFYSSLAFLCLIASVAMLLSFPNISLSARSRFSVLGFTGLCVVAEFILTGTALLTIPIISIFLTRLLQEQEHKVFRESVLWIPLIIIVATIFFRI